MYYIERGLPPSSYFESKTKVPTSLKLRQESQNGRRSTKVCLGRISIFRHGISRQHSRALTHVRWSAQIRCFGGDIESRSSDRDPPQIDRLTLFPMAVLVATNPNLLNCGSTAVADTAEDLQFRRLRPVAASTAVTNVFCRSKFADSPATAATVNISVPAADLSTPTHT